MPRPIGTSQLGILAALHDQRYWFLGCGWYQNSYGWTQYILMGLRKCGLVDVKEWTTGAGTTRDAYVVTDHGRAILDGRG